MTLIGLQVIDVFMFESVDDAQMDKRWLESFCEPSD